MEHSTVPAQSVCSIVAVQGKECIVQARTLQFDPGKRRYESVRRGRRPEPRLAGGWLQGFGPARQGWREQARGTQIRWQGLEVEESSGGPGSGAAGSAKGSPRAAAG